MIFIPALLVGICIGAYLEGFCEELIRVWWRNRPNHG